MTSIEFKFRLNDSSADKSKLHHSHVRLERRICNLKIAPNCTSHFNLIYLKLLLYRLTFNLNLSIHISIPYSLLKYGSVLHAFGRMNLLISAIIIFMLCSNTWSTLGHRLCTEAALMNHFEISFSSSASFSQLYTMNFLIRLCIALHELNKAL